jgi:cellobiose PTS system EIIC component
VEKFMKWMEARLMPVANKINKVKYLSAIGTTFQILLPIILIGSFACLGAFLDIPVWQAFVKKTGLALFFMTIQSLTLSIIALYMAFLLPYEFAEKLGIKPVSAALTSLMTFLLVTPHELYKAIPTTWLGYSGMFTVLIISWLVPRFCKILHDKNVYIHMPAGVPPIVEEAFAALVPAVFCAVLAALVETLMAKTSFGSIHQVIYSFIQTPLKGIGLSFPAYLFIQVLSTLFMFCGIHGNSIFSIISPLTFAASAENLAALTAGKALPNIIIDSFQVLCQPGGFGGTFGLAILMAFSAKSNRLKTLGKMSVIPAVFDINEPLLFGIPILLNPILFIPYVLNPILCTSISYIAIRTGLVPRLTGTIVNWTMPQIVSGFLAQGWQCAVLQVVLILVTTLVWFPFFKMIDRQTAAQELNAVKEK